LAWSLLIGVDRLSEFVNERGQQKEEKEMLWTIFVILLVLWLLGVVSSYTIGGFIHILLVLALVVLLINIIGGRRTAI
jgi:high-affinity K+ transport system ATPase subunit B